MSPRHRITLVVLLVLVGLTIVGLFQTSRPVAEATVSNSIRSGQLYRQVIATQAQFDAARKLAEGAKTREEKRMAREALRSADGQVDLAFAIALQEAAENPPKLSSETQALSNRLKNAQAQIDVDRSGIDLLKKELAAAKATGAKEDLQQQLQILEAHTDSDQDEVEDARRDLSRAGGDPEGVLQRMKQRYDAQTQANGGLQNIVPYTGQDAPEATQPNNVVALTTYWFTLRGKVGQLEQAEQAALAQVAELKSGPKQPRQDDAGQTAQGHAAQRQKLQAIDKRVDGETQIADTYRKWSTQVRQLQRKCVHQLLLFLLWILVIIVVAMIIDIWVNRSLARLDADRKQAHTLHTVAGYAIRGVGALLILLVVVGPPSQFAAVLALAGAGLTVALKDFIVAFIGWFVLMGRNGVRAGDWVEINGVSGEVLEIGPMRTVLLETGSLSEAGHPTGRKVTFMNGFAVEGNYFNFSTSGQWMWDEIQVAVPADLDPFATAEALKKVVAAETEKNAQLAADEWRKVAPRSAPDAFHGDPVMSIRPTGSGAALVIRYITRATERNDVRSRVYRGILDLQRQKEAPQSTPEK